MIRPIVCVAICLSITSVAWSGDFDPAQEVVIAVRLLEKYHVAHKPLDNQMAVKWMRSFVDSLDPRRLYFLESDLLEFQKLQDDLDDQAKSGDFSFPLLVRQKLRERIKEAMVLAKASLAAEHDYSVDEVLPIRWNDFAASPQALRERWRLSVKGELLTEKVHGRDLQDVIKQLQGRFLRLERQAVDMTDERLCQMYLQSLAILYDPHSAYIPPTSMMAFNQIKLTRLSLGLLIEQRAGNSYISNISPSIRAAGYKTEIIGCRLIAIGRDDGSTIDVMEMHIDDLRDLISSPDGPLGFDSDVILELMNPDTRERMTISWVRYEL